MPHHARTMLIGGGIALGILVLVALGLFSNSKPQPVPPVSAANSGAHITADGAFAIVAAVVIVILLVRR